MHATRTPRVKICCISSLEEARAAIDAGAAAIGLVSSMPSGPGVIQEPLIARLAAATPPAVAAFLLTSRSTPREIIDQQRRLGAGVLQICDDLPPGAHEELRAALPGVKLVQVVHVRDETAISAGERVAPLVDALLLDSGNQHLAVKELGGTGRRHDWAVSRRIREAVDVPLFLAGGLNCSNVREAIETVGPWGVDVCSGVRTGGRLDTAKLASFFAAVRG